MSTNDVPGANPSNGDALAVGCWAEHEDGSLIFVESTEGSRVVYSIFDMSREPPIEYRDAMPATSFNRTFSWEAGGVKPLNEKWTWHDKTPFPWDRIIKAGFPDGTRPAAAEHLLNAAQQVMESRERLRSNRAYKEEYAKASAARRVAEGLRIEGEEVNPAKFEHRMDRFMERMETAFGGIARALNRMGKSNYKGTGKRR